MFQQQVCSGRRLEQCEQEVGARGCPWWAALLARWSPPGRGPAWLSGGNNRKRRDKAEGEVSAIKLAGTCLMADASMILMDCQTKEQSGAMMRR